MQDTEFRGRVRLATGALLAVSGRATMDCTRSASASLAQRRYRVSLPLAGLGTMSVELEAADFVAAAMSTYATGEHRAPPIRHAVCLPPTIQAPNSGPGQADFHRAHVCHLDQAIIFTSAARASAATHIVLLLPTLFFQAMLEAASDLLSPADVILLLPPLTADSHARHIRSMLANRPMSDTERALLRYNAIICHGVLTEHTKQRPAVRLDLQAAAAEDAVRQAHTRT